MMSDATYIKQAVDSLAKDLADALRERDEAKAKVEKLHEAIERFKHCDASREETLKQCGDERFGLRKALGAVTEQRDRYAKEADDLRATNRMLACGSQRRLDEEWNEAIEAAAAKMFDVGSPFNSARHDMQYRILALKRPAPQQQPAQEEPLPSCPECGGETKFVDAGVAGYERWYLSCTRCSARTGYSYSGDSTVARRNLVKLWSRRAPKEATP